MKTIIKRVLANTIGRYLRLNGARIVYFHSVHTTHPIAHRPEQFRRMIKIMVESGRQITTINELGQRLRNKQDIENCLCINFDDGYADNVEIALPILRESGVRATFFIAAGLVKDNQFKPGRANHCYADLPIMTKTQLREISNAGMEIGSHTFSHRFMQNDSVDIVRRELRDSKAHLEDILGKTVVSFAFPNGEVPVNARQILQEEGYLQAATTRWDCVNNNSDPYFLPRQIVDVYDRAVDFKAQLAGRYDFMKIYQTLRRRGKKPK